MKTTICSAVFLITILSAAVDADSKSIRDSKHNLSSGGPGTLTARSESRICVFCHTTHRTAGIVPLWNRADRTTHYAIYHSSTIRSTVGQPTGSSRVCLSCHDGTIALGSVLSEDREIPFKGGIRFMPETVSASIGTDLSDDHPVSFAYDDTLARLKGELASPSALSSQLRLDQDRRLQCTTCHDPHDDANGKFLAMPNQFSDMCTSCHQRDGWDENPHALSDATVDDSSLMYQTVAENGCLTCHVPHSGKGGERLLKYAFEEDNCLSCHNGSVSRAKNIGDEIIKPYGHLAQNYTGIHDASEDFEKGNVPRHVECSDCHNPHRIQRDPSPGNGEVGGANRGATGIRRDDPVRYVYEICYKCHGNNNMMDRLPVARQIGQLDIQRAFNPGNPSFHPVESGGVNPDVPSLVSPYSATSVITCTDCHNSDGSGVRGPHGSAHRFLLTANYETSDPIMESAYAYELCYTCHARDSILGDESFPYHKQHVSDESTSCAVCHDPHGIDSLQGNALNNSHLINFDLTTVSANRRGELRFEDLGVFEGQCFLTCHGKSHEPKAYPKRP